MTKNLIVIMSLFLLASCATQPASHVRSQIERPQKIILSLTSGEEYDEQWRHGFESLGYEVIMRDEVNTKDIAISDGNTISTTTSAIQNAGYYYYFDITYEMSWDFVHFVKNFTVRVKDLRTRKMVATYSDSNTWNHPSVASVVNQIETEFMQKKVYK